MALSLGIITDAVKSITNKIWMDKGEKARLDFDRDELNAIVSMKLQEMEKSGELDKIEAEFKESQAQRDYAQNQFGSADTLKTFAVGQIILMGRASIRWVITLFSMYQGHRIVTAVLSTDVIQALAQNKLSVSNIWIIALVVSAVLGIPLFYVAGISIEKIMKSRGVI